MMSALGGKPDVAKGDRRFRFWTQSGMMGFAQATKKHRPQPGKAGAGGYSGIFRALYRGGPILTKNLYNSNPSVLVCYVSPRI
jgi:hypothetical protein